MARVSGQLERCCPGSSTVLWIGVVQRLCLLTVGGIAWNILPRYSADMLDWEHPAHSWMDIWGQWDTGWYLDIAQNGYSAQPRYQEFANYAFFPLYPLTIRWLTHLTMDHFLSGFIISNICLFCSGILLHRLTRIDHDEETARRSVLFLFLWPTSFILSGVFSESLFLVLCLGFFLAARRGHWIVAGLLGMLATLTRNPGLWLIVPGCWLYLQQSGLLKEKVLLRRQVGPWPAAEEHVAQDGGQEPAVGFRQLAQAQDIAGRTADAEQVALPIGHSTMGKDHQIGFRWRELKATALALALVPLGLLLFAGYNAHLTGDPLAFVHIQETWNRRLANPLTTIAEGLYLCFPSEHLALSAWWAVGILLVLVLFFKRLGVAYGSLCFFFLMVPLMTGLSSIPRYSTVMFPLFILAAQLSRNRVAGELLAIAMAMLQACLMVFWSVGYPLIV